MVCGPPVAVLLSQSLLVVITLTVIIGVVLIAFIVFTIIVLKRRNESRQKLGESLVSVPESVLRVSFNPTMIWMWYPKRIRFVEINA